MDTTMQAIWILTGLAALTAVVTIPILKRRYNALVSTEIAEPTKKEAALEKEVLSIKERVALFEQRVEKHEAQTAINKLAIETILASASKDTAEGGSSPESYFYHPKNPEIERLRESLGLTAKDLDSDNDNPAPLIDPLIRSYLRSGKFPGRVFDPGRVKVDPTEHYLQGFDPDRPSILWSTPAVPPKIRPGTIKFRGSENLGGEEPSPQKPAKPQTE